MSIGGKRELVGEDHKRNGFIEWMRIRERIKARDGMFREGMQEHGTLEYFCCSHPFGETCREGTQY